MRQVPLSDLRTIDVMGGALRLTRRLGPLGTWVHRRVTENVTTNMLGTTFMTDPTREEDRSFWRPRFAATAVPRTALHALRRARAALVPRPRRSLTKPGPRRQAGRV
jgi:hypothetical protein